MKYIRNKFKKGFTLIELLAVIVILAIIALVATPRIMAAIEQARKEAFRNDVYGIVKAVERDYVKRMLDEEKVEVTYEFNDYVQTVTPEHIKELEFTGRGPKNGTIIVDEEGNIELALDDDNWCCKLGEDGEVKLKDINEGPCEIDSDTQEEPVVIDPDNLPEGCVVASDDDFDEEWVTYIGSDTCVYIPHIIHGQEVTSYDWMFWETSVSRVLSDNPNITSMEGTFNGITSDFLDLSYFDTSNVENMSWMFWYNEVPHLDLSGFDTSSVTNMDHMFYKTEASSIDLSSFDTSNVVSMHEMFRETYATELDLSNFDTSSVVSMSYMFRINYAQDLDLTSFDTSNVENMRGMFSGSFNETVDLSSFDTSNVTDMRDMFNSSTLNYVDVSTFDTSNVTNMLSMFYGSKFSHIDLSSFDTSNVTQFHHMFLNSEATSGYARTQADADNFNSSDGIPPELTFVVN